MTDEDEQTSAMRDHAIRVLHALSCDKLAFGDDLELVAAANAYVHRRVRRVHQSVADSGIEVLEREEGVCGGMVLATRDLLNELGLQGQLAYALGGDVAHSMFEVQTESETILVDPYHGLIFVDHETGRGLGLDDAVAAASAARPSVLFVRRQGSEALDLAEAYARADEDSRVDFAFPRNFIDLDGYGLAGSGFAEVIEVHLSLGGVLGAPDWREPREGEPYPYSALAHERKADGSHLSWAYILGSTANGYNVQHVYRIAGLTPGQSFAIRTSFANAYGKEGELPVVSYRQLSGGGGKHNAKLEHTNRRADEAFVPQVIEARFVSETDSSLIVTHARGDFVLMAIEAIAP